MPRNPKIPTKAQQKFLARIAREGHCVVTLSADQLPLYSLPSGRTLGTDATKNAISRGWLLPRDDGLFQGGGIANLQRCPGV